MPYTRAQLIAAFRAENPDAAHIDDNKIFAAIAVEDPELAKGIAEIQPQHNPNIGGDDRTAGQVAFGQAGAALKGAVVGPIKGAIGAISEAPGLMKDAVTGNAQGAFERLKKMGYGAYRGIAEPIENAAQNAAAYIAPDTFQAPSSAANTQAAEAAGANLGSLVAPAVVGKGVSAVQAATKVPSVPLFTKTFAKSADLNFQKYAPGVLDELKSAGPINTVEEGLSAFQKRHDLYEQGVKHYLDPHKAVPAEEYRAMIRTKAIEAIPETATRAERVRMMRLIDERIPKNLTIGSIDKLRMESNARVRTANLNVTKGLAADMTAQAVEEALADGARRAVSHAMDTGGLGGGEAVRQLHGRVGTIMHGEDALLSKLNQAVGERAVSPAQAAKNKISRVTSEIPGVKTAAHWTGYEKYAQGAPMTIDEALRLAVKNHGGLPAEITSQLRGTPGPHFVRMTDKPVSAPTQMEMSEIAPHNAYQDYPDLFGIDATGVPPQYPHNGLQFGSGEGIEQTPYVPPEPISDVHEIAPGGLSYPKSPTEMFLERSQKLKRILGRK